MAESHQIRCITKTNRPDPHERITHVGGTNSDGSRWRIPQRFAIEEVEAARLKLYVSVEGRLAWVVVATTSQGQKYLKAEIDDEQPDNLLSLPECPL